MAEAALAAAAADAAAMAGRSWRLGVSASSISACWGRQKTHPQFGVILALQFNDELERPHAKQKQSCAQRIAQGLPTILATVVRTQFPM